MSDTSIISTISTYNDENGQEPGYYHKQHSSFCHRYWFHITVTLLSLMILTITSILVYVLYKQAERDRERRRIQNEFKQKHPFANKLLDMINKNGIIAKWLKANKGPTVAIFKQLITEMIHTIFDE